MIMNSGAVVSQSSYSFGDIAKDIIKHNNISLNANNVSVNTSFSVMSVGQLGFSTSTTYGAVCERAVEMGLSLCRPEIGPWLCLNNSKDIVVDDVVVAMLPLVDGEGVHHSLFRVRKDSYSGSKCLSCYYGTLDRVCDVNQKFVFTH